MIYRSTLIAARAVSLTLVIASFFATPHVQAIVDASSQNNTSAPSDGAPWANMGGINGAGGIYVGGGWVLTAGHVGPGNFALPGGTVLWDGKSVSLTNSDGTPADAVLFRLKTIPALPRLPLMSSTPPTLSSVDMIGFGYHSGSSQTTFSAGITGFYWSTTAGQSWGNNKIDAGGANLIFDGFTNVVAFSTTFDAPPLQTSDECQAAAGDSGGGVFYKSGSTWQLAGMIIAISEPVSSRPANSAVYTDQTYAMDVATYRSQIQAYIQSTVPALSIVKAGNQVQISWVDTGVSYNLEATSNLASGSWSVLSPPLTSANGQITASVPVTGATRFFRLQKP